MSAWRLEPRPDTSTATRLTSSMSPPAWSIWWSHVPVTHRPARMLPPDSSPGNPRPAAGAVGPCACGRTARGQATGQDEWLQRDECVPKEYEGLLRPCAYGSL